MSSFELAVNLFISDASTFRPKRLFTVCHRGATFVRRVDEVDYLLVRGSRQALF